MALPTDLTGGQESNSLPGGLRIFVEAPALKQYVASLSGGEATATELRSRIAAADLMCCVVSRQCLLLTGPQRNRCDPMRDRYCPEVETLRVIPSVNPWNLPGISRPVLGPR